MPSKTDGSWRPALANIWDLNFRAMPFSVVWAVSSFLVFQTSSNASQFSLIFIANAAGILSAAVVNTKYMTLKQRLLKVLRDRNLWIYSTMISLFFVLSLINIQKFEGSALIIRTLMVSIWLLMTISWILVLILVAPIRIFADLACRRDLAIFMTFLSVKKEMISLIVSTLLVIFSLPLFFIYIFVGLPLFQSRTLANVRLPYDENKAEKGLINAVE
jgi:hypothetical protein